MTVRTTVIACEMHAKSQDCASVLHVLSLRQSSHSQLWKVVPALPAVTRGQTEAKEVD